jgi:putative phage-type endonuclease
MLHSCDQGTAEWLAIRLGKVTASRIADMMATTKSGPSASRTNYAAELVAERLTGVPTEKFISPAMMHGTDTEEEARNAYCFFRDAEVVEVGFVDHPTVPMSGASPDGLVGEDGLLELKCPNTATHISTLMGKSVPSKYVKQIMWQLACTGRQWCDFASYDPRLPESMRLIVIRLHRDDAMIAELEREVAAFLAEVETTVTALRSQFEPQREAA